MSNYLDTLNNLMNSKKKRDPNTSEKKEFASAWSALVKEEGFSTDAEKFLYDGLSFCGASPFMDYMDTSNDRLNALQELYDGALYGKNCVSTSTLLIHLLSLSLNKEKDNTKILVSLMKQIPVAIINKDGTAYVYLDKTFRKYLFETLNQDIEFPAADDLLKQGLDTASLKYFTDVIYSVIEKLKQQKLKTSCKSNMHCFEQWIRSLDEQMQTSPKKIYLSQQNIDDNCLQNDIDQKDITEEISCEKDSSQQNNLENCKQDADARTSEMERLFEELHGLRQKLSSLEQLRMMFSKEAEEYKQRIDLQDHRIQFEENEIVLKNERIKELETEKETRSHDIAVLNEKIAFLQDEVQQRDSLIEMIRRDRSKQTDEGINRLESMTKPYYLDYQDAKNIDMSLELGENIRDQFGELLSIVSSFISSDK